ncbi:hypothetical protein VKT23_019878 [Stygiomarasmius scandens]|uniref:Glucose-methanol-choline oxidoreductase N-terminal domain-containing protein n=1 Tax=Marasmiellus scandens TaxID=2682957 RepID=A0ABR1ILT3_9AGAR
MLPLKPLVSLALVAASLLPVGRAALFTNPSDLPRTKYDFIVIGAGTAGNVVANRLSEDSSKKVLVVEAGLDDAGLQVVEVPFFGPNTVGTSVDWNFTTVPQADVNGRSLSVPRGFVLGGSSSLNYMVWTQGSKDLYDSYAQVTSDSSWSWNNIVPFFKKVSTFVPPTDNPTVPPPSPADPTFSNGNGPVKVTFPNFPTDIDFRVINASKEVQPKDGRFRFTKDMNGGDTIGFGLNQENTGGGQRSSSSAAYLRPILSRPNLDVLIQTRAMRLVETSTNTFTSVEVAQSADGPVTTLSASKEIILSAGAIGTPHILLLSGIGPKQELEAVGVESTVDLPNVGKNLADHPFLFTYYRVNSNTTFDDVIRNSTLFQQTLDVWTNERKGLFSTSPTSTLGYMRIPQGEGAEDPTAGPTSAHTEIIFLDGFTPLPDNDFPFPEEGHYITVCVALVSPKSKGSLTLASAEHGTFTHPNIDYALLSNDWDMQALLQALRDADTLMSASPWTTPSSAPFVIEPFGIWADAKTGTDADREVYIRNTLTTVFHPVGSARMSADPSDSVLDSRLRVRGVKGVRAIDASIFPQIPQAHPQAAIYTIAERGAQMIKEDNGC